MKKALIAIGILLAAAACNKQPTQPELSAVKIDTLLVNGVHTYEVAYDFVSIANAAKSPALEAIERANIGYFFGMEEFAGTAQQAAQASIGLLTQEIAPEAGLSDEWGPQRYSQSVEAEACVADTLLTYSITQASYTGGAHGSYIVTFHTYSLESGLELTLADLFTPAQVEALNGLIREKIYQQYAQTNDEGLISQGFFPEYIAANDNFRFTPDGGMIFYYNPYEIGCYALGAVEVEISQQEREEL